MEIKNIFIIGAGNVGSHLAKALAKVVNIVGVYSLNQCSAKELSDEHELPRPLDYYIQLFETAFDFISSNEQANTELLHKEYVTFSE